MLLFLSFNLNPSKQYTICSRERNFLSVGSITNKWINDSWSPFLEFNTFACISESVLYWKTISVEKAVAELRILIYPS